MKLFVRILLIGILVIGLGFVSYKFFIKSSPEKIVEATSTPPKLDFPKDSMVQDFPVNPKDYANKKISIYVVPHADDETLTYSVPILNDIREGKEVFAILASHGDSTGAFVPINKKVQPDLTRRELGAARMKEFIEATKRLGIKENHVLVYDLMIDTHHRENDRNRLKEILTYYAKQFPQAEFKGMSQHDMSSDHALIGEVISELKQKSIIQDTEYFLSINMARFCNKHEQCLLHMKKTGKAPIIETEHLINASDNEKVKLAAESYNIWDPSKGWYAIGYHSVPGQFKALAKDAYTVHTSR